MVDPALQALASAVLAGPGPSRADPRRTAGGTSLVATAVDAGSPADSTDRRTDPHVCGRCGVLEPGLCGAVGFRVEPGRSTQNSRRRDRPCRCVSRCWGPGYPTDHRKDPLVRDRSGGPGPGFCGACGSGAEPGRSRRTAGGTSLVATAVDAGSPADPTDRRTDPHVCGRCGVSEPGLCCAVGFRVEPGRSTQNSRRRDRPCRCVSGCWGPGYPTDRRKDPLVRGRSGIAGPGFCGACGSGAEPGRSTQNSRRDQPCCYGSGRWESC